MSATDEGRSEIAGDGATRSLIERLPLQGDEAALTRINPLRFARNHGLDPDDTVAGFVRMTDAGLYEASWDVICPTCGGVLHRRPSLSDLREHRFTCNLCQLECEPELDRLVEVTFTVHPRVRQVAAHDPERLPLWDYVRQLRWSTGAALPPLQTLVQQGVLLDAIELGPKEQTSRRFELGAGMVIVFDPVTHTSCRIMVGQDQTGGPDRLAIPLQDSGPVLPPLATGQRQVAVEFVNQTTRRVLPLVLVASQSLLDLFATREDVLTASRLLTNQTFRDLHRTDVLTVDQQFKITSLTFMFTDLKGSTDLYDRVGDLAAFGLVQEHFRTLGDIVAAHGGAIIKTIGDAVMATFIEPARALAAALAIREAMTHFAERHGEADIPIKIGLHAGPCLAVLLNGAQDYFGQAVNIAARVQSLADGAGILATSAVTDDPAAVVFLDRQGRIREPSQARLRGVARHMTLVRVI